MGGSAFAKVFLRGENAGADVVHKLFSTQDISFNKEIGLINLDTKSLIT